MPQESSGIGLNIAIEEIYKQLCPKCKEKLEKMVEKELGNQYIKKLTSQVLRKDEPSC